ncbi:hypothetical protein MRX96_057528 [Rhipicephalus microplus]
MGRSTRSGFPSPLKRVIVRAEVESEQKPQREPIPPPTRHRRGTPGGKQKRPRKITWREVVTETKADSTQGHHFLPPGRGRWPPLDSHRPRPGGKDGEHGERE